MKIAYINSFYAPMEIGGAEKSVRFLAETMVANGHQASIITLGRQRETAELNGVRIERLQTNNLYFPADASAQSGLRKLAWHTVDSYNPLAAGAIGKVLDTLQPDIVHTNNLGGFSVSAWSAVKARNIPVVHTLRDYYLLCPNTAMFKNGRPCERRCTKCAVLGMPRAQASQGIDHVVGNSQFILDKHRQFGLFQRARTSVVYNAYQPSSLESSRPTSLIRFGFIGRLAPTKGLEVLIDAIRLLSVEHPAQFELLVAGTGTAAYEAQLKERAVGLPIRFMGHMKPEDLYNSVHWTVLPSMWDEPLARVLFESFAHGVPVIGSATGGTPELLADEQCGLIYQQSRQPSALAAKMLNAIQTMETYPERQAICLARAKDFRPESTYDQYLNIYQSSNR